MAIKTDWLTNFDITRDDLQRVEEWLNELKRGVTLEELTRRIIRGRLRFGHDESPSALPEWVQEKHVLSWDEEDKWCVGCQVLVAKGIQGLVTPFFGVITDISDDIFYIQINDAIVKYARVKPGSKDAQNRYEYVKQSIWERENQLKNQSTQAKIDEQVEIVILKNGVQIASRIQSALEKDKRFSPINQRWYLQARIQEISLSTIQRIHRQILKTTKTVTMPQLREHILRLPEGEIGEVSLVQTLAKVPDLFKPIDNGWQAIPLPPPPPEQAIGAYYVYDPQSYAILLRPGQRLTKEVAERLIELGYYAEVVQPES